MSAVPNTHAAADAHVRLATGVPVAVANSGTTTVDVVARKLARVALLWSTPHDCNPTVSACLSASSAHAAKSLLFVDRSRERLGGGGRPRRWSSSVARRRPHALRVAASVLGVPAAVRRDQASAASALAPERRARVRVSIPLPVLVLVVVWPAVSRTVSVFLSR